ncbi:hypothetical protein ACN47E_003232 [Coniothyrium glycines]
MVSTVTTSASSATASRGAQVHTIKAGAGGFKFTPQSISNVSVGDIITFEFYPPDHSVARAAFGSACVPYEYTGKNKVGFWSETQWVNNTDEITYWNLTINDTAPIFFYCAAPNSCTGQHMVGAINPNATQTIDEQIKAAIEADFQVEPGQPVPAEASSTLVNAPTSTPPSTAPHKLSGGAIAGIVIGCIVFLAICAALFYLVGRSKTLKEQVDRQSGGMKPSPSPQHQSMSSYGQGGLGSPYQSSGFPSPAPYSAAVGADGFTAFTNPPQYGQHYATEQHPSGWTSPGQQHTSYLNEGARISQQQVNEIKYAAGTATSGQPVLAELHSPTPGQAEWRGELDGGGAATKQT